jgi:predicted alpha/beta hydrolase
MSEFETLTLKCQDGYTLSARFYAAATESKNAPILICPATGITKQFYHHFSCWLQAQGYTVLVFDFRGIGESLTGPLKYSKASIVQWGQLDIPAAIDSLLARTQAEKVILLGHSAGGQLLGIVPNYAKVEKVVAIAGSTGHVKGLKGRTRLLAPVMFKIIFPLARISTGYGPTQVIGMGENLPKDVAREWAQFCSQPGYVLNAIGKKVAPTQDYHTRITCPVTSIWASDDEIATPANVKDLLRLYPQAQTEMIELKPQEYGHKSIGHMLMFKKSHQNLWPLIEQQLSV